MSSNREVTDFAENHYYRLNRIFLSMLNLWPYQQSKYSIIIRTVHFSIMFSFLFFQLTSFLTLQVTMDVVITVLSYAIPSLIFIIQYFSFYTKSNEIKQIYKYFRDNWSLLKNRTEHNIMRQYSSSGELCTITVLLGITVSFILYAFIELLPTILDIIFPLNETRPREIHAMTEYFVDEKTYYYLILCHWLTGACFGGYVLAATGTLELAYVEHVSGLFRIASYRIEHSIDEYVSRNSIRGKKRTALQNINAAVNMHQKAFECCDFIITTFAPSLFVLIIIGVASLSCNLLRLLRAITLRNMNELISSNLVVGIHFMFFFVGNYYGQKITDNNNKIFNNAYNAQWYIAPVKIQKLVLFIMQRTTKAYILIIGNLVTASIEDFARLMSTAISYFTVIYSLL